MPRNRQRTTNKGRWTKEDLENARKSIVERKSSIREASKKFGIPFATLQRRMKTDVESVTSGPAMGRKAVLSPDQERVMVESIKLLGKLFYGLNCQQIRYVAYEFADRQSIIHNFNKEKRCAGRDWLDGFLKRNPAVKARKPESPASSSSSSSKVAAFNKQDIAAFFDNLETIMRKHYFASPRIFAVDETVITTIQEPGTLSLPGILVEKGQKRTGPGITEERGKNLTVVCGMNAAGAFVPPMFVFPRQRISQQLQQGGPADAIYHCTKDGCFNSGLFLVWLQHFKAHAKPTKQNPCLLVLDNHLSHVSLRCYEFCAKSNIVLVPIPPHTSHRMQPLNVAFYGPLKKAFRKECEAFMTSQGLKNITQNDLATIFNKAYLTVADVQKAAAGFRVAGICPVNRGIFTNEDFLPTKTILTANDGSANYGQPISGTIEAIGQPSVGHFLYTNFAENSHANVAVDTTTSDLQILYGEPKLEESPFKPFPHTSADDPLVY